MENVKNNYDDETVNNQNVKNSNNFNLPVDRAYVWLIVGKPNSGKTHFLKSIFYDYASIKHFKFGIIYTQNKMNCDLDFCPEKSIKEYTDEDCEKYINKLMKYKEENKDKPEKKLPPSFMVFEDCIGSKNMNLYSDTISKLLILHRHLNISIFFLSQYLGGRTGSSTLLRECMNYAILFSTRFHNSKDFLFKSCGGLYKKQDDFIDALEKATSVPHRALFYDSSKDNIDDAYFAYTAPEHVPKFKLVF
jgi:hypothetical protein